ncbi:PilN domain-containing protein [Methylococcus sp. EFPC2]|uniref:PilN domain-containing protein n=1 Tax=Methylococcus sp. EFPC2 TaxID=2812648 RepID=UPI001967C504|nr:PilN domain-containing protein [Methylococcus sp. EFPC2]QSA96200.1 PilN domain-containing protein [Methylococcus sp. EFPC2]
MARINLLPWRAELRKQRQKDFAAAILLGVAVTFILFLGVRAHIAGEIEYQYGRNQYLESEIAALDKKIKEIEDLESKKKRLLARMDVIQQLQVSRPEVVHLIDELARTVPDGVYVTDFAQTDKNLTLNGYAQSNARVSAYMRNLDASPWLKEPVLTIIESRSEGKDNRKERTNKFTLQVKQGADKPEEKAKGAS